MSDQFAAIFRRRPNDGWFRAGGYDITTTDILCGLSVLSMFLWGLFRERVEPTAVCTHARAGLRDLASRHLAGRHRAGDLAAARHRVLLAVRPTARVVVRTRQVHRLGAGAHRRPGAGAHPARPARQQHRLHDPVRVEQPLPRWHLGVCRHVSRREVVRGGSPVGRRRGVHRAQPVAGHGHGRHRPGDLPAGVGRRLTGGRPFAGSRHRLAHPAPPARRHRRREPFAEAQVQAQAVGRIVSRRGAGAVEECTGANASPAPGVAGRSGRARRACSTRSVPTGWTR